MSEDLTIQQLRSLIESPQARAAQELQIPSARPAASPAPEAQNGPSFAETLRNSINEINNLQIEADASIEKIATGESKDIQETIIAVQKADVSFKLMMEMRNKIISAYQEVMRTQV